MIQFINAKINLGLYITSRRTDGYHNLQTVFYPIGLHNGTDKNPQPFCDILEITPIQRSGKEGYFDFLFTGNKIDCPLQKNLVVKAAMKFLDARSGKLNSAYKIHLEKHIPDGAGLGGGSADCAFTLRILNTLEREPFSKSELQSMAAELGADCPFFIINKPCYAEGIGEQLQDIDLSLKEKWCVIVKPDVYVSTREAFGGITPRQPDTKLVDAIRMPMAEWKNYIHNQFEDTIFKIHPELRHIKDSLYAHRAEYAAMSGSGSSLFGIFDDKESAQNAAETFSKTCYTTICML